MRSPWPWGSSLQPAQGGAREHRASAVPKPRGLQWRGRSVLDWSPPGRFRCGHQRKEEWAFRPNPQMSTTATTRGQTRSPVKSPGLGPQFPGVGSRFRHRVSTSPVSLSLRIPIWGMGAAAQCCRPDQGANTLPRGQASPAGVPALGWGAKSGLWTVP